MNQAARMSVAHRLRDLLRDPYRFGYLELRLTTKPVSEGFALDKLHRIEWKLAGCTGFYDAGNTRVIELGNESDFAEEAFLGDDASKLRAQDFYRGVLTGSCVNA